MPAHFFLKKSDNNILTYLFGNAILNVVDTEEYPSLAEGVGLENREASRGARGFESLLLRHLVSWKHHCA